MMDSRFFISPTQVELWRIQTEGLEAYQADGFPGALDYASLDLKEKLITYGAVASALYFPTTTQLTRFPALIGGRLTFHQSLRIYGGHLLPIPSLLGLAGSALWDQYKSRGRRDSKSAIAPVEPGRRPRPIIPSRPTSSGQTSKPFWSSGKPKCKKGYRYDFRRKLCVKIR